MLKRVLLSIVCLVSIFVGLLVAASPVLVSYASFTNYTKSSANAFQSGAYCSAYDPMGTLSSSAGAGNGVISLPASSQAVVAFASGAFSGYALRLDGTVYAWGDNGSGRLGTGSKASGSSTPATVSLPQGTRATQISGGRYAAYAVDQVGAAYAWGWGGSGALGNGQTASSSVPVKVSLPSDVTAVQVAGGLSVGYALTSAGAVYAWGSGRSGALGNGQTASSSVPVKVSLPSGVKAVQIAAGSSTGYAVASDGAVYAWGAGSSGQLGNGQTGDSSTPVKVALPSGVTATQVAGGGSAWSSGGGTTVYAVGSDGAVYAWGSGGSGALGNGQMANSSTPVKVSLPSGVTATQVAAGAATGYAVGSDGAVYAWGAGSSGQLGNGQTGDSSVPVKVALPSGVAGTQVAGGVATGYAVGSDGAVYAWGAGSNGQLGNGQTADSSVPVKVSLPSGVTATQVAGGAATGYVVGSDGAVYAWGAGVSGALGNGQTADSSVPVKVSLPSGVTATQVAGGAATGYVVGSDGAVYAWGAGVSGALGNGQTADSSVPVKVSLPSGVTATQVAAGDASGYIVGSDGAVYAWGAGAYGQLGNGQTADSSTPVKVSLPSGVTAKQVAAGKYAAYAVGSDGAVYAWGEGSAGQLGNGQTANSSTPVKVSLPSGVTATIVAGGSWMAYAVGSDSATYAWGGGSLGQLGNGQMANSSTPVKVSLPPGAAMRQVAGGYRDGYAVGMDGTVYAWGWGASGRLGNGQTADSSTPVKVGVISWSLSSVTNVAVSGASVSYSRSGCSSSLTLLFAVPARDAGPTPVTVTFTDSSGSTYSYTKLLAVVPG